MKLEIGMEAQKIRSEDYKGKDATVFQVFQSSLSLLIIAQNEPVRLCNAIVTKFEERLENEKDHQSADLIRSIGECPDLNE